MILVRKLSNGILLKVNPVFGKTSERRNKERVKNIDLRSPETRIDLSQTHTRELKNLAKRLTKLAMMTRKKRKKKPRLILEKRLLRKKTRRKDLKRTNQIVQKILVERLSSVKKLLHSYRKK